MLRFVGYFGVLIGLTTLLSFLLMHYERPLAEKEIAR